MAMRLARRDDEINRVMNWAAEAMEKGSKFPGMTYEDGVEAAISWLIGDNKDPPDE